MRVHHATADALRAEARLLMRAGVTLLCVGFPLTLILVAQALGSDAMPAMAPIAIGAPPIILGYLACHFASMRLVKAKSLEGLPRH